MRRINTVAVKRLTTEYKKLTQDPPAGITAGPVSENDLFVWEAVLIGPEGTEYEGGILTARLTFPADYPMSPPKMTFTCPMWHPNIYANGDVCISILHPPTEDPTHYESISERWSPVQNIEKILLSVQSLLSNPNCESPANVDAAVMYRTKRDMYNKKCKECVEQSKERYRNKH